MGERELTSIEAALRKVVATDGYRDDKPTMSQTPVFGLAKAYRFLCGTPGHPGRAV